MSRDAVAELVHRYADAVVHYDADLWASTWSQDATWVLGPGREVEGREAIVDLWLRAMSGFEAVVQNVVNGEARFAADGATGAGRWYIMEHFRRADGTPGILLAYYDDTYVNVDGAWLFASRQLTIQYQGPPDLSAGFKNRITP
jgi:uncharacterized protein (TIGR02246 family)